MAVTQLPVVKALPFIIQNTMSLFTVLPLAVAVLSLTRWKPELMQNGLVYRIGFISYEIYLVHAFTLDVISGNAASLTAFAAITLVLAVIVYVINTRIKKIVKVS